MLTEINDIQMDSEFGDFVFKGDLQIVRNDKVLVSMINERIKSNFGDFRTNLNHGADLERFLGVGVTDKLIDNMILSIKDAITYDGVIEESSIEVSAVILGIGTVYFRIIVSSPFTKARLNFSTIYNKEDYTT